MNSAISACEKSGCWAAALRLPESAKEAKARSSVLAVLALLLVSSMWQVRQDTITYNGCISSCEKAPTRRAVCCPRRIPP